MALKFYKYFIITLISKYPKSFFRQVIITTHILRIEMEGCGRGSSFPKRTNRAKKYGPWSCSPNPLTCTSYCFVRLHQFIYMIKYSRWRDCPHVFTVWPVTCKWCRWAVICKTLVFKGSFFPSLLYHLSLSLFVFIELVGSSEITLSFLKSRNRCRNSNF